MHCARSCRGMVVAPHSLAAGAGLAVLRKGGNAVQAAVATAASLCVVYPHMTGLGGDAFWLVLPGSQTAGPGSQTAGPGSQTAGPGSQTAGPGGATAGTPPAPAFPAPVFIDACGRSAALASRKWYAGHGLDHVPKRGPLAALTVAGAVSGWEKALSLPLPGDHASPDLAELFADAVLQAENGFPVTNLQAAMTRAALDELRGQPGFARTFLQDDGATGRPNPPAPGRIMRLPDLGRTLRRLARDGLDSFYRGKLASDMALALEKAGSPLRLADLGRHQAEIRPPLSLRLERALLYNAPPPTQGVSSLMILGLMERHARRYGPPLTETALVHSAVEATKAAFVPRDQYIGDPASMERPVQELLEPAFLDELALSLSPDRASPWPRRSPAGGDTVWFGAADQWGNMVSVIQSIYHEFGSGLVLPDLGIAWHNRGLGFTFAPGSPNTLGPGKKPFHTLNPALALLDDGRVIAYGSMGGEGQPQTQAALYTRYAVKGQDPQQAVQSPRWLLGRAWGDASDSLKLEASFPVEVFNELKAMGHCLERIPALSSLVGHAGMIVRHADGLLEAGFDPRGDGTAAGW